MAKHKQKKKKNSIHIVEIKTCNELTLQGGNNVHYKFITEYPLKNLCTIKQNCIRADICQKKFNIGIEIKVAEYWLIPLIILKIMWRPSISSKSSQTLKTSISFRKKSCCIWNINEMRNLDKDKKDWIHKVQRNLDMKMMWF